MRILAIDTALSNCAAAVLDNGPGSGCFVSIEEEIGRGHAEHLMDMIGEVMAESATAFSDLDRIAVTVGPGSFTGLRVGLSVARGFGLVLEKPVVGITTLAALARGVVLPAGHPLLVALSGKGEEVYCQEFAGDGKPVGAAGVRTVSDLARHLPSRICLAGSAANQVAQAMKQQGAQVLSTNGFPEIRDVAELGLTADPSMSSPSPLYLRSADATPQKKGRIERL